MSQRLPLDEEFMKERPIFFLLMQWCRANNPLHLDSWGESLDNKASPSGALPPFVSEAGVTINEYAPVV